MVKTLASHAGIRGSTPLGSTNCKEQDNVLFFCCAFTLRGESKPKGWQGSVNLASSSMAEPGAELTVLSISCIITGNLILYTRFIFSNAYRMSNDSVL